MATDHEPKEREEEIEDVTPDVSSLAEREILQIFEVMYRNARDVAGWAPYVNWGEKLAADGFLKNPDLIRAFSSVKRYDFLPFNVKGDNVYDKPLPLGYKQTISQPSLVALMLESLELESGQTVEDIGTGSGYTTGLIANVVGKDGRVDGAEAIPELVEFGNQNLSSYEMPWASIRQAGASLGISTSEPYDRILVSAQIKEEWLQLLVEQLSPNGGVLVVPIASKESYRREEDPTRPPTYDQKIIKVTRNGDEVTQETIAPNTAFVPIVFTPVNGQATLLAKGAIRGIIS